MDPLQVGITGGIGSGKSLVCRIFKCLGVPLYDADAHAKNLMSTDSSLIELIKKEFGATAYNKDGTLNRSVLAEATFGHPEHLKKLNSLVHPRVAADYHQWVQTQKDHRYVIREAALLYEAGVSSSLGIIIVVSSPEPLRIKRVLERDPQRTEDGIKAIMKNQWPEEEKLRRADFIIYNDDQHMIIPQVLELHTKFSS